MLLIGQYDSPFVRRVGVALRLYDIAFEHRSLSAFRDADELAAISPLRRVPTLVLDDGDVLSDSGVILDQLDERVGPERALIDPAGLGRRKILQITAIATSTCDKLVSLFYELRLHPTPSTVWVDRCADQIIGAMDLLEGRLAGASSIYWVSDRLTHADIATTCMARFLQDAHGARFDIARWPRVLAHADRFEALPVFREISQPFAAPAAQA